MELSYYVKCQVAPYELGLLDITTSVTRLGNLLDFGKLLKAFGNV